MPPDDEVQQFAQLLPDIEPTPGGRATFTTEQFRLSHEAEKARGSAMELLGKALNNQPEITPSQGFAAALLGAIPTIGGYMLGNAVGRPNIPQGTYFKGVSPSEFNQEFGRSGANYGGQQGAQIGNEAAQGYFKSREDEIKQRIPIFAKQAAIEEDRAQQLDQQAQTMNLHGLDDIEADNRQNQAFQNEKALIPLREQSAINIANTKTTSEKLIEEELAKDPLKKAAFDRISANKATEGDYHVLSPGAIKMASGNLRSGAYAESVQNTQDFREGQTTIPGFVNKSNSIPSKETVKEVTDRNFGIEKTANLLRSYIDNPDSITGQESAVQAAIDGLAKNAQRMATGSGANYTATEQALVNNALPAIKAGNVVEWMKREALGRDQKQFAKDLISLYRKSNDFAIADTYGQFRQDAPEGYYPQETLARWGVGGGSSSGGLPAVGGTFQGKKVLSVEKVG